jgi:hypothetical protein
MQVVIAMSSSVRVSSCEVESRSEVGLTAVTDNKIEPLEQKESKALDQKQKGVDNRAAEDESMDVEMDDIDESIDAEIDEIDEVEGFLYLDDLSFDDVFDDSIDFEAV